MAQFQYRPKRQRTEPISMDEVMIDELHPFLQEVDDLCGLVMQYVGLVECDSTDKALHYVLIDEEAYGDDVVACKSKTGDCETLACGNCKNKNICLQCVAYICIEHQETCISCDKIYCHDCFDDHDQYVCSNVSCDDILCHEKGKRCFACDYAFCSLHLKKCIRCRYVFCLLCNHDRTNCNAISLLE